MANFFWEINSCAATNKFVYIFYKYVLKKVCSGVLEVGFLNSGQAIAWLGETMQQLRPAALVQSERKSKFPLLTLYPSNCVNKWPRMPFNISIIIFPKLGAVIDTEFFFQVSDSGNGSSKLQHIGKSAVVEKVTYNYSKVEQTQNHLTSKAE